MKLTELAIASVFAAAIVPFASMADDAVTPVTGSNTGVINFTGSVVNTPCNIKQESLKQDIDFGQ